MGLDIIDIGAESTRPGAKRVSEEDEQTRVLGAVDALIPEGAVLSIDTTRASVARMALEHGAQIINDVSGGQLDREVPHAVAEHTESLYIVQHWRGWLAGSAGNVPDADTSVYANDVVNDVYDELMKQVDDVLHAGVALRRSSSTQDLDSPSRAWNTTSRLWWHWNGLTPLAIRC